MANLTAVTTNFFPTASETYSGNLSATIGAGATTLTATNLTAYTDGDVVVLTIEPGTANEATFTGTKAGSTISNVKWTEGNVGVGHDSGVTIVDYDSATHFNMLSKGVRKVINQDGTLVTSAVQSSLNLGNEALNGWNALAFTPASVTYNGSRSYTLVFNGQDLTTTLSTGMRIRTTRTVAAPTQSTNLNGTNQYWTKTGTINGMTFTDDFVVSAWVKLNNYPAGEVAIASRYNGSSGWWLGVNPAGLVQLTGHNGAGGNFSRIQTYHQIPLGRWVHITAQLDMSTFTQTTTTSYIMLDGTEVTSTVLRSGTNPTAIVQAGNLEIGGMTAAGGFYWPGKIAQVAIFSAKLTLTTARSYYAQGLSGSETSLVSAYSLSGGTGTTDLNTTNANNLVAGGGTPNTTNADSPFGGQGNGTISSTLDYAIIGTVAFSTNTTVVVVCPEGNTIPTSGGINAVVYSAQANPYNFRGSLTASRSNTKFAVNHAAGNLVNTETDLAPNGLITSVYCPIDYNVTISLSMSMTSTTDFEFKPIVRIDNVNHRILDIPAAAGSAGNRAVTRSFTYTAFLSAGYHTISAAVTLLASSSATLQAGSSFLNVQTVGELAA